MPQYQAVLENKPSTSSGGASVAAAFDPVEVCPLIYTTRLALAKMLIELEEWEPAIKVSVNLLRRKLLRLSPELAVFADFVIVLMRG